MEIRRAALGDASALLPMIRELFRDEAIAWDEARTRDALAGLLADDALGRVLIATDTDGPCGYAIVTWGYDLEFAGRDAFLTELFVVPQRRRQGVGARILAAIEAAARAAGAGAVHLQVRPDNPDAQRLYLRTGFAASPRIFLSKPL